MRKNNKSRRRVRLIPLILGSYGMFLGFGLAAIGLAEIKEGIGIVRFLMGLGMAGFGLLGIWDGIRDLVRADKKPGPAPASQFILTDTSGNKSSLVTPDILREQISILAENEDSKHFDIRITPPFSAGEYGLLKQILCCRYNTIVLAAFFEMPKDGYRIYQKSTEPDLAAEWLSRLLAGNPDFSEWESMETKARQDEETASQNEDDTGRDHEDICSDETDASQESIESFWRQLLTGQKGQRFYGDRLLVIFGESWHDEHKFFSARDVELTAEGIHEGKYTKAVLEWGTKTFDLFPGVQKDLMVIWCTNNTGKGDARFLAKEGTVTQVKFWLVNYMDQGFLKEMSGWTDITIQVEKEKRKGKKKHGKIF